MIYLIFLSIWIFVFVCILFGWFLWQVVFQAILGYGVPYVPTPDYKVEKLLQGLRLKSWQKFLDIWCGDGKIVEAVKKQFPKSICTGVENSLYPYFLAKRRQKKSSQTYVVERGNFFLKDISEYNTIYCYLMPLLMKSVWKKIQTDCRKGTLLYSSAFEIPDVKYYERINVWDKKWVFVYKV